MSQAVDVTHRYESPMLYKTLPSGAMRQWRSWSEGARVYTEFGQVGGKLQQSLDVVRGKSAGRANATTPAQQAALEAKSLFEKMVKKGYVASRRRAASTTNALPAFLPMLAHVYDDKEGQAYPAYVQPKLDGVRCLAVVTRGVATLYTRSQKLIDTVPHVNAAIEAQFRRKRVTDAQLDGELYNHEFHDDFGRILGAVKRKEVGEDMSKIHYYVYDAPSVDQPYTGRMLELAKLLDSCQAPLVKVVTEVVVDEAAMRGRAAHYVSLGFEGAMYRSATGRYEGKRSTGLLKVKVMRDEEFEVVGFQEGTGKLMGYVGSFHCVTSGGVKFKAKLEGELKDLPNVADGPNHVGRTLTVRFQDYTPDGSPRFPVGVRFKDAVEG